MAVYPDSTTVRLCSGDMVQETGASNVLLVSDDRVVTPALDGSFLEGVTWASVLALAAERGMTVEERPVSVEELVEWCNEGEMALAGTAAVLAPVGSLVIDGEEVTVGDGAAGRVTLDLRQALVDVQAARLPDTTAGRGWSPDGYGSIGSSAERV